MACVRYWAGAREIAGTAEQSVAATSLAGLLAAVCHEHGDRMARLVEVALVLVDGERVARDGDQSLTDAAVVEILPPYAGG
jgi:molybdopterin converting factor small subunit